MHKFMYINLPFVSFRTHVKLDAEQAPPDDGDQVVQDAADAAGIYLFIYVYI
jgi:hypothetical protein